MLRAKEKERRSSIVYRYKKGKTIILYTKEKTITGARCRASVPRLGLLLGMGAGEAHGGYTPPGQISC